MRDKFQQQSGSILVLTMIITASILLLAGYFFNYILIEIKMSRSHYLATQTYYQAEAGTQEGIWRVKNNAEWLVAFQTNPSWEAYFSRNNPLGIGGSYQMVVANSELGRAEITATGLNDYGGQSAKRLVKAGIYQPQGGVPNGDVALFSDDDFAFTGVSVDVVEGGIFTNSNITLNFFSDIDLEKAAAAVGQIVVNWGSSLTAEQKSSVNFPPAPEAQDLPQVDFDSAENTSLINQASHVYSSADFGSLMSGDSNLTLSGVVYVTGDIFIPRGENLTVNGALVADGSISIGTNWWPESEAGGSLVITDPGSGPVGLFSKQNINFNSFAEIINVTGLVYGLNSVWLDAYGVDFSLNGGMVSRSIILNSLGQQLTIYNNSSLVVRTLEEQLESGIITSPIINIEHWEEQY